VDPRSNLTDMPTTSRRYSRSFATVAALTFGAASLLSAQQASPAGQRPAGWTVRPDGASGHGSSEQVSFVTMKPGYHVTTGPAAILFDSTRRATGDWRMETVIHLFDPGTRAEGFGVLFGGSGLSGATPRYSYALFRRDGKAMIKVREGATTRTVREWTANGAIPVWRGGPAGTSVRYPIVVEARGDRVSLWIGATQVLDAPRSELPTDGIIGLRINHALDVHVESLAAAPLTRR
jgi:hypothetical protein